jgi:hypothetical protein
MPRSAAYCRQRCDGAGTPTCREITTHPQTQDRLLELVIANNEIQARHTPGYRSATFTRASTGAAP